MSLQSVQYCNSKCNSLQFNFVPKLCTVQLLLATKPCRHACNATNNNIVEDIV